MSLANLQSLLDDPSATLEIVVKGMYLDADNATQTLWLSRSGWQDEPSGPAGVYCPPLVDIHLTINRQLDPLDLRTLTGTYAEISLINDSVYQDYMGLFDPWWSYSVDQQEWLIYIVGILSNSTRIEIADVEDAPLYRLVGVGIPEVGSSICRIQTRDQTQVLETALQPMTYSPPCLSFPGTVAGALDLGDNINITGVQSLSAWIYLTDPTSITQYILFKDSGSAGYYLAVGLVGGGTIAAGVEIVCRGQSPAATTTAANVLRAFQWHRIDISIDTTVRRIDIDGTTAITTSSITGTPTTTSTSLSIGRSLLGRIHRVLWWSNARSSATMSLEGRTPITGLETNLREAFLFGEGQGDQVASSKSGSSIVGILGAGVLWDTTTWHYQSILGQYEPYILGTVPRVPVTWIDPPKQIGQVSRGPIALLSELQSNHTAVSTANYTVDLANGTLTVTSGALSGTYSATVTANNLWNSALLLNGSTSQGVATLSMPTGSRYVGIHFRVDNTNTTARQIVGWNPTSGTQLQIVLIAGSTNTLALLATNDAGIMFTASTTVVEGKRYSILGGVDIENPSTGLRLYLNGSLVAMVAISGTWANTTTAFNVGRRFVGAFDDNYFKGAIDEVVIGNTAPTLEIAKDFHSIPSTSLTGIVNGWHFDEATGTSASPFAGAVSITLSNITRTAGRSAPIDLARSIVYDYGYDESDLYPDSWFESLNDNLADCGWFVTGGAKGLDILNIVLGGLGFVLYESLGLLKVKRFEGLTGVAEITYNPSIDVQNVSIEPQPNDLAVREWVIQFATNNTKIESANVAGGLASTDPDRYQYASTANLQVVKNDATVLERFPSALSLPKVTALLNRVDAEDEGARLLAIHKHGGDRKQIPMFVAVGGLDILTEIGPLIQELDLDRGTLMVIGISTEDDLSTVTTWRPALEYPVFVVTDENELLITDENEGIVVD